MARPVRCNGSYVTLPSLSKRWPAAGTTACSERGPDLGNKMADRPPASSTSDAIPGAAHRRHPASMSQRGGRRGPADYRHRLRRDRRLQGHPGRLPAPAGRRRPVGGVRQRPRRARRPARLGRPPRRRPGDTLLPGGHRAVLRAARHRPGRRRPARQRGQPRPGQGARRGRRAGQQDRPGRPPRRRRVRPRPPPAGLAAPPPEVRELQGLVQRREDLREMAAREKGRLDSPALTRAARQSITRAIQFLGREADRVQAEADALIAAAPALKADRDLLASIPGVGAPTAATVLADLPPVERLPSAQSAAACAGLAPREFRSGASLRKRTRLSKARNARLRQALLLPTQTAIRFNPLLKGFFERLVGAGKPKMQAVGACMRKLVMLCYGVLKNRAPFDPDWASKKAP